MGMLGATPLDIVNGLHIQACRDLLAAYGSTAHLQPRDAQPLPRNKAGYVSVLGATGEGISLLSTLNFDAELLARTHRLGDDDTAQRWLHDWCRELNNQLMGRIKNKLLELGCELTLGLPSLVTGFDIRSVAGSNVETRESLFASTHGYLALTLATLLAPDFSFSPVQAPADGSDVVHAGVVLF
jgi:hypothetical protein